MTRITPLAAVAFPSSGIDVEFGQDVQFSVLETQSGQSAFRQMSWYYRGTNLRKERFMRDPKKYKCLQDDKSPRVEIALSR
jgi:hypothetical protein